MTSIIFIAERLQFYYSLPINNLYYYRKSA